MTTVERVADQSCEVGEGPLWHPMIGLLYWVDIPNGQLFCYDPVEGEHSVAYERDGPIGGFTIEADGTMLLFEEEGRIEAWDGEETRQVRGRLAGESGSRFNDVIAGPRGGVFAGTMPEGESSGRLYYFGPAGTKKVIEEGVETPNGMGFSPDLQTFYFVETGKNTVYRYRFDAKTSVVSDRESFIEWDEGSGRPDGMTVDSMGHLWIAFWEGARIERRDPAGELVETIELPTQRITSLTLGGFDHRSAFVTSAALEDTGDEDAGALFHFDAHVRGLPEFRSQLTS